MNMKTSERKTFDFLYCMLHWHIFMLARIIRIHVPGALVLSGPYADVWKTGCEFKGFYKVGYESLENSDFDAKIRGVNLVSGANCMLLK